MVRRRTVSWLSSCTSSCRAQLTLIRSRHYRNDLQPYICLSEKCFESRPTYSTSAMWFHHMTSKHSEYWAQTIHDMGTEAERDGSVCPLCLFSYTDDIKSGEEDDETDGDGDDDAKNLLSSQGKRRLRLSTVSGKRTKLSRNENTAGNIATTWSDGNPYRWASPLPDEHLLSLMAGLEGARYGEGGTASMTDTLSSSRQLSSSEDLDDETRLPDPGDTSPGRTRTPNSPPRLATQNRATSGPSITFDERERSAETQLNEELAIALSSLRNDTSQPDTVASAGIVETAQFFTSIPATESDFSWEFVPRPRVPPGTVDSALLRWPPSSSAPMPVDPTSPPDGSQPQTIQYPADPPEPPSTDEPDTQGGPLDRRDEVREGSTDARGNIEESAEQKDQAMKLEAPKSVRDLIAQDLLNSERKYVRDLESLNDLRILLHQNGVLPSETIHGIFSTLDQILEFQRRFLVRLETVLSMPPEFQRWGAPFVQYEISFEACYVPFILNQQQVGRPAGETLVKMQSTGNPIAANVLVLGEYLLKPLQRLMQYHLLLKVGRETVMIASELS